MNASRRDLLRKIAPYRLAWQSLDMVRDMAIDPRPKQKKPGRQKATGLVE